MKKHYSSEEIKRILEQDTGLSNTEIYIVTQILDKYGSESLKIISKSIQKIAKGK